MIKSQEKKTLVLLDVHAIIHRAYHALPDFATSQGEPTGALYGLSTMLLKIIGDLKPDYLAACYDLPKPTYRHEAYKDYKAGRAKADEELVTQLKRSRDIFDALNIPIFAAEGFEADDMIGTIVEQVKADKNVTVVIASGDMDTLQLVKGDQVRVYTLKKGIKDTIIYNEQAVIERFGFPPGFLVDYKGLRGDPSDNIIGIKGIGEKTASVIIQKFGSLEAVYQKLKQAGGKDLFKQAGLSERIVGLLEAGEEEAQFSKMLATIRRDAPINFKISEKTWRENLETEKIIKVWSDLEFRTLGARLGEVLGEADNLTPNPLSSAEERGQAGFRAAGGEVDAQILKEAQIALWLLNSNLTNPGLDDILNQTGRSNLAEAYRVLLEQIKEKKLTAVFENIEKLLIPIIEKMEKNGVKLDTTILKGLSVKYHQTLSKLEKEIWTLAGEEFNVNSTKQLGEILFIKLGLKAKNQKKTSLGKLSTKESELEKLRDAHPIIPLILNYRELQKALSTYIDNLPQMVGPDGRLHAKFLQTGTTTGRMSSQDPNLQNIPNRSELGLEVRKAFVAASGYKLVAFDYSQMELRIAAFLSGDEKLIDIFKKGEDVHTAVAAEVFGVPLDQVDKEMRRRAKVINFGIMYGMGVLALKQNMGVSRAEAQKFYDDYFAKFSGLARYLDLVKAETLRTGFTETFFGRRRYFEGIKSKLPFIRAMNERMAINAPIQGTEADIIKLAMIKVDDHLQKEKLSDKIHLLLQVHDELVYEIKEDLVEKAAPKIKEIMEMIVRPEQTKGVVCRVEYKVGDNWGEMEKMA